MVRVVVVAPKHRLVQLLRPVAKAYIQVLVFKIKQDRDTTGVQEP
jgi:hypothetical protein